jgi:hypothetical protein
MKGLLGDVCAQFSICILSCIDTGCDLDLTHEKTAKICDGCFCIFAVFSQYAA